MTQMTYRPVANSYFSGAGLMDYGLMDAGIDIQQSLEYDPVAVETLKMNYSHQVISADIRDKLVLDQMQADIMIGTYPCNKYSTIADIHGARTGDDLFLHFFRHVVLAQPEAFLVENVPGMLKFPVVMEAMSKIPQYYTQIFCPVDARDVGLPQRRNRLLLFGTQSPFTFRPPEGYRQVRLRDILETDPDVPPVTKGTVERLKGSYRDKPIVSDPDDPNAYAPTAVAHYEKDRGTRLVKDRKAKHGVRSYTAREYARLQGVPDSFSFAGSRNQIYKQVGNGVAVPVAHWAGSELIRYFN